MSYIKQFIETNNQLSDLNDRQLKAVKQQKLFIEKYNAKTYNKIDIEFINKLSKRKFILPKYVKEIIGSKQSFYEFLVIANYFKANKKFINLSLIKRYIPKTTFYRALDFFKKHNLVLINDKKQIKFNFDYQKSCYIKIKTKNDWMVFFLYGLTVLWTKKMTSLAKKFASNKKEVLLQNKFLGLKKSTAFSHLKKLASFELLSYKQKYMIKRIYNKIIPTLEMQKLANKVFGNNIKISNYQYSTVRYLIN
ncbi:hypothetical protein GE118_00495 [Mycoplasma sp. NEAQ87857]|uniref:MAGa4850 family ICE element protein n=1 Tax=Mycoplasma sp. NEAQ87857 TaxID=2683967 RepID=UPI001316B4E7|nr:hypothetical protein [Mycoplasma sp. NEAQ87857]QGZ97283.1 hypothetical protein GE118_00495 [Mycoplasma sp. NEAQ87857]